VRRGSRWVGQHDQEYFAIIAADVLGSVYREQRRKACEAIEDAIVRGLDPGERGPALQRPRMLCWNDTYGAMHIAGHSTGPTLRATFIDI
jgi:hypothetical protein